MANILIGTPTTGEVKNAYCQSVCDLQRELMVAGHAVKLQLTRGTDIAHQRNLIASRFYEDERFSHLLFIDSDIQFAAGVVVKMLGMGKPFVGGVYPKRYYDLERLVALARSRPDMSVGQVVAKSHDYTVRIERKTSLVDGACVVDGIGMGLALIERGVFQTMISRDVARVKRNDESTKADLVNNGLYDFFDTIDGMGEDYSFCRRWKQCDGEIWAVIDADIGHIGDIRFGGSFLDSRR